MTTRARHLGLLAAALCAAQAVRADPAARLHAKSAALAPAGNASSSGSTGQSGAAQTVGTPTTSPGAAAAPSGASGAAAPSATGSNQAGSATLQGQPAPPQAPATPLRPPQPAPPVARFGRFDLDQPLAVLAQLPELKACAPMFMAPLGHGGCALPPNDEKVSRIDLAWNDARPGGEVIALYLTFDPQLAPPLTDLEWQLTRGWGAPALEQLRRDHDNKLFTLQWEDAEHRATLEASGLLSQPSRAVAIVLERKARALPGELATLRPRPFPNMRVRMVRRLEYDGQPYAMLWGTSLTPAQEALGEGGPAWAAQRSYIGLFKLDASAPKKRWKPLWERTSGDEEDNDLQRIARVDLHNVTGDGDPDLLVELSCPACGQSTSEVLVKTVRAGKAVDLLDKHDLYRASVDARPGQIRIREAEGDDTFTVTTYAYDKGKGAFVLAREEREGERAVEER